MSLRNTLEELEFYPNIEKAHYIEIIVNAINNSSYTLCELNDKKPWGAYFRMENSDANDFIYEFFPGLDPVEARFGVAGAELSPKFLLVSAGARLSWQYHERRAERWSFITPGLYCRSSDDSENDQQAAKKGDVVQFQTGERHRLIGQDDAYTLVAEIWQHTNPTQLSDEDDIIRISDDYSR